MRSRLTDVVPDQRRNELLDRKRMEAQRRTENSLSVVSPRMASHRKELVSENKGEEEISKECSTRKEEAGNATHLDEFRLDERVLDVLSRQESDDESDELGLIGGIEGLRSMATKKSREGNELR